MKTGNEAKTSEKPSCRCYNTRVDEYLNDVTKLVEFEDLDAMLEISRHLQGSVSNIKKTSDEWMERMKVLNRTCTRVHVHDVEMYIC